MNKQSRIRRVASWLACGLVVLAAPNSPADDGALPVAEPRVEQGRLWLSVEERPLDAVLKAIAEHGRFELILNGELGQPVTASFEGARLEEALEKLTDELITISEYGEAPCPASERRLMLFRVYANAGGGQTEFADEPQEVLNQLRDELTQAKAPEARTVAVQQLARIATPGAVDVLIEAMPMQRQEVREEIIEAFVRIGGGEGPRGLGRVFDQENEPDLRAQAIDGLAELGTYVAKQELEIALTSSFDDVRAGAEAALAEMPE